MSGLITTEKLLREQEILYRRSTLLNEEGRLAKVAELARMASMELLAFIILDRLHDLRKVEIIHHRNPEIAGYFSISGKKRSVNISIERLRKISPEAVEKVYSFFEYLGDRTLIEWATMEFSRGLPYAQEKGMCACLHPKNRHRHLEFTRKIKFWNDYQIDYSRVKITNCEHCECTHFDEVDEIGWLASLQHYAYVRGCEVIHYQYPNRAEAAADGSSLHEIWLHKPNQSFNQQIAHNATLEQVLADAQRVIEQEVGPKPIIKTIPVVVAQVQQPSDVKRAFKVSNGLVHALILHTYGENPGTRIFAQDNAVLEEIKYFLSKQRNFVVEGPVSSHPTHLWVPDEHLELADFHGIYMVEAVNLHTVAQFLRQRTLIPDTEIAVEGIVITVNVPIITGMSASIFGFESLEEVLTLAKMMKKATGLPIQTRLPLIIDVAGFNGPTITAMTMLKQQADSSRNVELIQLFWEFNDLMNGRMTVLSD